MVYWIRNNSLIYKINKVACEIGVVVFMFLFSFFIFNLQNFYQWCGHFDLSTIWISDLCRYHFLSTFFQFIGNILVLVCWWGIKLTYFSINFRFLYLRWFEHVRKFVLSFIDMWRPWKAIKWYFKNSVLKIAKEKRETIRFKFESKIVINQRFYILSYLLLKKTEKKIKWMGEK